jgi:prepilin-type N-terminal cleavage/methylation domain-containing protein
VTGRRLTGSARTARPPAEAGFTLIELLVGIVLSSIFAIALFGFFFTGVDHVRSQESQARAQMDGRTAVDRLVREARQAISPDEGLTPPVISLSPVVLEMYVDPSRATSALTPRPERVRYSVVANQLIRESATPVGVSPPYSYGAYGRREVMVERLANGAVPAFRGVTAEGVVLPAIPATTQLRDIAQISVRLLISQKTGNAATTLELNTDVALRNAVRL